MIPLKNRLTEAQKAYLAGLFDGEGCIGYYKRKGNRSKYSYVSLVTISQTDFRPILWLHEKVGFGTVITKPGKKHVEHQWTTNKRQYVYEFLEAIQPYLILKREQADLLLAHITIEGFEPYKKGTVTPEIVAARETVYQQLRSLKTSNMLTIH
jgi:intein/homing endonuclease